jgi:outer membrane protein assembly factor BamB
VRQHRRLHALAWLTCALACTAACGGGQTRFNLFSTEWEDDRGASIARVWQRVGGAPIPPSADVALGISGNTDKIIGLPLASGSTWKFAHPLDARPVVAGTVVVGSGGGEAFALDATTGSVLWRRPTGGIPLLGAGDDGTVTVVTFRRAGNAGSTMLAVTHDGQVVRQIETDRPLGAPAVLGRMAFVPWAGQYVSVIDLTNGDETARVTLREETSRAWTEGGSLWFGQGSFIHFDERIRSASQGGASVATLPAAAQGLPGTPRLMRPGMEPVPAVANAEDKARLYARAAATDSGATLADGRWYATYFRLAMGFGDKARVAWARLHGADFVGGTAIPGALVLCDEQGKVIALDQKTGGTLAELDLGEPVRACVVNADAYRATGDPKEVRSLSLQLSDVVRSDDARLAAAQTLLLRELASLEDETVTRTLVDVVSDPRTTPEMVAAARSALAGRRNGAAYLGAALERHYDYLKDVLRTPPVGPIAQALGAMKDKRSASLLAAHLLDPADSDDDVKQAAAALAVVAGPKELPALREFFAMYRATAESDDLVDALVSVGEAMIAVEEKTGRSLVAAAANDPSTVPSARDRLSALVEHSPDK